MPKHAALGISLKSMLRSKHFINVINKFGDCISYDQALRIDTFWAEDLLQAEDGYAMVPSNIVKGVFAQAASDNCDYMQALASYHVTNSVIYQYPMSSEASFSSAAIRSAAKKRKSRSRKLSLKPQPLLKFTGKLSPQLPDYLKCSQHKSILDACKEPSSERINMLIKNYSWYLSRNLSLKMYELEPQDFKHNVPGWTGFHYILSRRTTYPTVIGNCRTIPAPPTNYDTVLTVLVNIVELLKKIGQIPAVVTCDQAFYEKAMLVKWNYERMFGDSLVLRMGNFHTGKNFIGVIGKRMESSGLESILDESGLFKEGRIDSIMKGRSYNVGMRAHKVLSEALNRNLWKKFE